MKTTTLDPGECAADAGEHLTSCDVRETEVEHDDVRVEAVGEPHRLGAAAGFPHHLEAAAETERRAHHPAHVLGVVDEEDGDGHVRSLGCLGVDAPPWTDAARRSRALRSRSGRVQGSGAGYGDDAGRGASHREDDDERPRDVPADASS